jgi:hypothetical protein
MRESPDATVKRISLNPGTDILPNWQLTLDVATHGYWFIDALLTLCRWTEEP